jgi:hypothetical protein
MTKTFKAEMNFRTIWEYVNTPDSSVTDAPSIKDNNTFQLINDLTNGTGARDVASTIYHDIRSLSASSNEEFDLAGGISDSFGDTLTFTIVRGLIVANLDASSANTVLEIGGATNAFDTFLGDASDKVKVAAGGIFIAYNPTSTGYAVTAGTGDSLKIANTSSDTACSYHLIIIGE